MRKWKPPRGIRFFERPGKGKPFFVEWRELLTGKRVTRSFKSEADREAFAREKAKTTRVIKAQLLQVDEKKWLRFLAFEERIGGIENLDAVEALWLGQLQTGHASIREVGYVFIDSKERQGVSDEQLKRYKVLLKALETSFPGVALGDLSAPDLTRWIDRKPVTATTKNNLRKLLGVLFRYARLHGYVTDNPVERMDKWGQRDKPVGILTPEEGRRLFEANRDQLAIGRLALEAFAGLRYSSAKRIQRAHINFAEKGIELPAGRLKTRKRIYVDGFPETVWKWLEVAPSACWTLTERHYQQAKGDAFLRANIPHPHNCLRHSFATYHVAKYKNVGETATLLCHTNIATLNRFYRGNATHAQGVEWFDIFP